MSEISARQFDDMGAGSALNEMLARVGLSREDLPARIKVNGAEVTVTP